MAHDKDREQPIYFTWQILEWPMLDSVQRRIQLNLEQAPSAPQPSAARMWDRGLVYVPPPEGGGQRSGLSSPKYAEGPAAHPP
jgi:hypothetical protein